jgi:tetratricopeptide (TPR) repeat protein
LEIEHVHKLFRIFAIIIAALTLFNCSRDPQVVKKKYLESGNKYFERGKYKEASIMYRRALSTDPKYGEAYYKLAMTALKMNQPANAVPALRRAIELLPKNSKEADDSNLNLAEILLFAGQSTDNVARAKPLLDEASQIAKNFLDRDPNSYEGHKLTADSTFAEAIRTYKKNDVPGAKVLMETAISEYRKTLEVHKDDPIVMLALARTLAAYGELGEAEQLFRTVIDKHPNTPTGYVELYRLYASQRKASEGEALLKKASANNPKEYQFRILLAAHYFSNGNRAEGTKVLEDVKKNFKDFPQAYFTAGDFYLRMNDTATAIKQYEEGEKTDSAHKVDYQKRIIEVLVREGKTAQAYDKNLEILKENPKDPEARGLKATFLLDKGDVNQALSELQAVVTVRPDNFVARFHLGRAHMAQKHYEQASQQFQKAIELRPDYLPPRLALAQVALARGDNEGALKTTDDVLKINPNSGAAKILQAAALMRLNRFDESRKAMAAVLATNPKQPDTLLEMGVLNLMEKKYSEAVDYFKRGYEADPANSRGLLGEAEGYLLMNRPDQALAVIQTEINRFPNRNDLKRDLADLQFRTGQIDTAIQAYQSLLPAYKDNPAQSGDLHARIAEAYIRKRNYPQAIEELKKAHELLPESTAVLNTLALLLENGGNHQEAKKAYEKSLLKDPSNPEALNNLAYLMAETGGNLDEALTLATRAKQKLPNFMEISDTIGWIYLKKNLSDSAIDIFKDLTAKVPQNATYHYHYAMALVQKGDKNAALKECKLALGAKPAKEEEQHINDLIAKIS